MTMAALRCAAQDTQKPPPKGFLNAVIIWPARTWAMATATASISDPGPVSRSCQKLNAWAREGIAMEVGRGVGEAGKNEI